MHGLKNNWTYLYVFLIGAMLVAGATLTSAPAVHGQVPLPDPFLGADAQVVADLLAPSPSPVALSDSFIGNADASLTPNLSIADLAINAIPLSASFIGNADARVVGDLEVPAVFAPVPNQPPTADAGPDRTILVGDAVQVDGSGSSDPDGDTLSSYIWLFVTKPPGSVAALSDSSIVNPTFIADVVGNYVVQLIVNDGKSDSTPDEVTITVITTPGCDMVITKTASSDTVLTQEPFTYDLGIRNNGGSQCDGVQVLDKLPKGVSEIQVVAFIIRPCTIGGHTVSCDFGTMHPGDNGKVTITVNAPMVVGTITNGAKVSTTSDDPKPDNNKASETTVVLPRDRSVVFIQGIDSSSSCVDDNDDGLPDQFVERVDWMRSYLESTGLVTQNVNLLQFLYFGYSGTHVFCGSDIVGVYEPEDTCDGVEDAATKLRNFISNNAVGKTTIIAHSMGGLIAAYLVVAEPIDWVEEHIASVVTFDSPLRGVSLNHIVFLDGFFSVCDLDKDPPDQSLIDLFGEPPSSVVQAIVGASPEVWEKVPLYTIDAGDRGLPVEFVPGESTTLNGAKIHRKFNLEDHTSVWESPNPERKRQFVGCGVILANSWGDCRSSGNK